MKTQIVRIIVFVAVMLGLVCIAGAAKVPFNVLPVESYAYGKSLTDWTRIYWRWTYTDWIPGDPYPQVPSYVGRVALMPLPVGEYTGGSGSPADPAKYVGQLEVTFKPGTPFVLPLFAWILERYEGYPTVPDDSMLPKEAFELTNPDDHNDFPVITLDGRRIYTNFWDHNYVEGWIDPPAYYVKPSSYGSIAAVGFQGATIVVAPLTPGTHTLRLYEKYVIGSLGLIYDNTWIIRVE